MNEVIKTIFERRAVRKYKPIEVSKPILEQIIDAGRMAPSALGKEPWNFYIITSKEDIKLYSSEIMKQGSHSLTTMGLKKTIETIVSGIKHLATVIDFFKAEDPVFHAAPVVIFITAKKNDEWAALDIGMCSQNMMLAAKSLGLDSCPIGFAKIIEQTNHYSKLGIPKDEQIHLAIIIGYGNESPEAHLRIKTNAFFK